MQPITEMYGKEYFEKYVQYAHSEKGKRIYESRWQMISRFCHGNMSLLDYGCATGAFHQSSTNGFKTSGYDVNKFYGFTEKPDRYVDILTMWDVIEHLPDPVAVLKEFNAKYLFLSTPNLESVKGPVTEWKHYRPYEHIHYFDRFSLEAILGHAGYDVLECNYDEGAIRDSNNPTAIISVVARLKA